MTEAQTSISVDSIRLSTKAGVTKAFCSVTFGVPGGRITIHNIRYCEPQGKPPFVSCPDQKNGDKYYSQAHIAGDLTSAVFKKVQNAFIHKLEETNRYQAQTGAGHDPKYMGAEAQARAERPNPEITEEDIPF